MLSCSAATGLTTTPCYGLCTPAERTIIGAKLSDSSRTITIGLNTRAAAVSFPCVQLFDTTTMGLLGAASLCSVDGDKLMVQLPREATIMPGQSLVLAGNQAVLRDAITTTAFTTPATPVTLTKCSNCAAPTVVLGGTKVGFESSSRDML